jgi:1-acyl-sn-glycerol-3-phosphate acyltransferase
MGKDEMKKIPFFGYMYKRMHITVDRDNMKSRYDAILKAAEVLDNGRSITIFPEGGIISKEPPNMVKFKDGAFRLAIEKQVAVVPVTIPYNWIILPDDEKYLVDKSKIMKVIFHEPIETEGTHMNDLEKLKERTFSIIEKELRIQNT